MDGLLRCDSGGVAQNVLSLERDLRRLESGFVSLPRLHRRNLAELRSVWHREWSRPMCFNSYRPGVRGGLHAVHKEDMQGCSIGFWASGGRRSVSCRRPAAAVFPDQDQRRAVCTKVLKGFNVIFFSIEGLSAISLGRVCSGSFWLCILRVTCVVRFVLFK
jgi:hypothetical protein